VSSRGVGDAKPPPTPGDTAEGRLPDGLRPRLKWLRSSRLVRQNLVLFAGGLVAGIVVNISEFLLNGVVLKKDYEIIMKSMNKPTEMTALQGTVWIVYCFVVGIAAVWLYAAIRSRYGASAGTAGGRASPSGSLRTCSPTSPWPT